MQDHQIRRRLATALKRRQQQQRSDRDENRRPDCREQKLGFPQEISSATGQSSKEDSDNDQNATKERTSDRSIEDSTWKIAILTGVLAVIAFVSAIVSGFQWWEIHSGSTDTHSLAIAAKTQAEIAQLDQRAWLGIQSITPTPSTPAIGKTFEAKIELKNTGKTPALHIEITCLGQAIIIGNEIDFSYEKYEKVKNGIIFPNAIADINISPVSDMSGHPIPVSQEILTAIQQNQLTLVVHGRVDYDDVFGKSHWLLYCSRLTVPFNGAFELCGKHNETGDNE